MFADVVRSMTLAAVLDSEQLRDLMGDLFNTCGAVIQRYGGTVNQFTGDGIMALFGAPVTLEDHAVRACVAALEIQREVVLLGADIRGRHGLELAVRVGLDSGDVVVGQIGSTSTVYTAIGAHVGMAQRMESVAPPGGVMLSETTSRLVEHAAVLGAVEMVTVKGAATPVRARRLQAMSATRTLAARREATLIGRNRERELIADLLDEALRARGCVVGVSGPAGIGKSRICRDLVTTARTVQVVTYTTFCESHCSGLPFHALARLLRDAFRIDDIAPGAARSTLRTHLPSADPDDLVMLDDLLGIRDATVSAPDIPADARRRRLAPLIDDALASREGTAVYIIEDAHWIDEASESLIIDLIRGATLSRSMVMITYRPEYRGALAQLQGLRRCALGPLADSAVKAMTAELLGDHPSMREVAGYIIERSAGNPFYVQEIIRELAERQVIAGERGAYRRQRELAGVSVPDTLQATIGARLDRLSGTAKRTLNAAAVIGSRFDTDLLTVVLGEADRSTGDALAELVHAELIDQVLFSPRAEFAFRHALVRTVAYESQLKSARARVHRRLAAAMERTGTAGTDDHAALIAGHLEAAGDDRDAFGWHMRAGAWLTNKDINAARRSWQRARALADRLPAGEPDRATMRITPRALLCGSAWRAGAGTTADFNELRELCVTAESRVPLVMGMAGAISTSAVKGRIAEALQLAPEYLRLLDTIADPALTVGMLYPVIHAKYEAGQMFDALTLSQRVIDLAGGDAIKGNFLTGSPLAFATAMRASARCALGIAGWRSDFDEAMDIARVDPTTYVSTVMFKYLLGVPIGAVAVNEAALGDTAEALQIAQRCSEDFALYSAQLARGIVLVAGGGADRSTGLALLDEARTAASNDEFIASVVAVVDVQVAVDQARSGDLDAAVETAQRALSTVGVGGAALHLGTATAVLVESLVRRGGEADLRRAHAALDRLEARSVDPGFALHELASLRMRGVLARAEHDEDAYRSYIRRYQAFRHTLQFDGAKPVTSWRRSSS
ncbi:hypothetical protein ASG82_07300 [Mycobacterium sp. Soil538]|nr:hypothetical protein ASG82_07300 [Mycobacterium sp. Soil538]